MERIDVREARLDLSVYLERVKHGEAFTVTEHGRPVAVLAPLRRDDDPLADLYTSGRLSPAQGPLVLPEPVPLEPRSLTASQILQQMRDEERY